MARKCRHDWEEMDRRHYPPTVNNFEGDRLSEDLFLKIVYGITVVELTCQKCGDIKSHEMIGAR